MDLGSSKDRKYKFGVLAILLFIYVAFPILNYSISLSPPKAYCVSLMDEIFGNFTSVNNPVPAIVIEEGEIPVGKAHTYTYKLIGGHKYHVYLTGEWANPKTHNTDYDIYVYGTSGVVVNSLSSHTESAGLIEQVGNDGNGQYFIPDETGTYWFNVQNDPLESSAAEAGTFIVIENIETNQWISRYLEGKVNGEPRPRTNWAYEFVTSAERIHIYVDVPTSLDMYEARLYVMANPEAKKGELIREIPVAWEPGMRGEVSGGYGGFNFDPQGFRNLDAMDSCEFNGEDMVIDFEAPTKGSLLYHLVLIAEYGTGRLEFMVQTDLEPPILQFIDPPTQVVSEEPTQIRVNVTDYSEIKTTSLSYSTDDGVNWKKVTVGLDADGNYGGIIPRVDPGEAVDYVFEAEDVLGNIGEVHDNYTTRGGSSLEIHLSGENITGGKDITVDGRSRPGYREIGVNYTHEDEVFNFTLVSDVFGNFEHVFRPTSNGEWQALARFAGDNKYHPSTSETLNFTVNSLSTNLILEAPEKIEFGRKVALRGAFSLELEGVPVEVVVIGENGTEGLLTTTAEDGSFNTSFEPENKGVWWIQAKVTEDGLIYRGTESQVMEMRVVNPSLTTTLIRLLTGLALKASILIKTPYLYGVVVVVGAVGGGIYIYIRRRE